MELQAEWIETLGQAYDSWVGLKERCTAGHKATENKNAKSDLVPFPSQL